MPIKMRCFLKGFPLKTSGIVRFLRQIVFFLKVYGCQKLFPYGFLALKNGMRNVAHLVSSKIQTH